MKSRFFTIIAWSLTIIWMVTIFYFSNQTAEISRVESANVLVKMNMLTENEVSVTSDDRINSLQRFIRKFAHVFVYSILGLLLTISVKCINLSKFKSYFITYAVGSLYGALDEIHQYFIPGRGPMLHDVYIDSLGVIIGIVLAAILIGLVSKVNNYKLFI